jgi:very-short-patch-repair endonuclease
VDWQDREAGRWLDEAGELTRLLWWQHGAVSREDAVRHLTRHAVDHRVASGLWQRPHVAVYVAHNGPLTREQKLWVAVLGVGSGAVLAGSTATERCGLRGFPGNRIHVLIPAGCRDRHSPTSVVVHRSTVLPATDINDRARPPHTTTARSLVDAASWADTDAQARAIIAAGFQQRLVAADDIHLVLKRMPRARRRALIAEAATDALGGAQSLPEAEFVRLLRRAHLPVPRLQVRRRDNGGHTRYLDGYYDEWRLHIEIDGGQHMDVRAYWADMRRQNALWVAGDRILRFPSWAIRREPEAVVTQVAAALRAAGWRPQRPQRPQILDS